jgi:signal transduction histidine kinase
VKALGKLFRTTAFKLSLTYLVLFSFGAWMVLGSVGWRVKEVLDEQISHTVEAEIQGLAEQYSEGGIRQLALAVQHRVQAPGSSIYLVTTYTGDVIAGNITGSSMLPAESGELIETTYQRSGGLDDSTHLALARLFLLPGGFRLVVGHDIEDHDVLRKILRHGLGASLFWLVLVGTMGGLFVAHRLIERVDIMSASARRIMAGDLDQRLSVTGAGDELDRLAENFNAMLSRISELMTGLREVSDNIAHDLKTPLTRLRNRADEVARSNATPEESRAALASIIEESDGLIRVFDALLMIARAEAGYSSDNMSAVNIGEVASDIVELYGPVAEEQGARIELSLEPELFVCGNRELLGQVLVNLVDNAIKYGLEGAQPSVVVQARHSENFVEISVADHGPGIALKDRERVTGRFVRLDNPPSRSRPGSGLGLSLASAVAHLHHGALRIEDNEPGLRVIISLPRFRPAGATSRSERG